MINMTQINLSIFNTHELKAIKFAILYRSDINGQNIGSIEYGDTIDINSKYVNSICLGLDEIYFSNENLDGFYHEGIDEDVKKNSLSALQKLHSMSVTDTE